MCKADMIDSVLHSTVCCTLKQPLRSSLVKMGKHVTFELS